jgi:iron complex transport system substrate-binding protein
LQKGTGQHGQFPSSFAINRFDPGPDEFVRLLSLLPSATEMVHALGLGQFQVGRSHECDYPPCVQTLPACTSPAIPSEADSGTIDELVKSRLTQALSFFELNTELIAELKPTHIITQTQCHICAVSLQDVEQALSAELSTTAKVIALAAESLEGVWADIRNIAQNCGVTERGEQLVSELRSQMERIRCRAEQAPTRPKVACIEWLEPVMSAGNWVPELVQMADAESLFGEAGQHSPYLDWQEIAVADPDVIVCLPCGFDLARTEKEMHALTDRCGWPALNAVRTGQVYLCDGNQFMNRPGPRLMESLRIFAELFHPDLFEPTLEGTGWKRFISE